MGAMDIFPGVDLNYVNLVVMVDPNWHRAGTFIGQSPGGRSQLEIIFCTMAEEGIAEELQVSYATTDVLGRSEHYYTFTGNANRQLSLTFNFVAQGTESEGDISDPFEEVVMPARWLESLKLGWQDPGTGLGCAPPPLILIIGDLFAGRVLATDVSPKWNGPFEPGSMMPHSAEVRCTFTVVRTPADAEGGYGGFARGVDSVSRFLTFANNGAT